MSTVDSSSSRSLGAWRPVGLGLTLGVLGVLIAFGATWLGMASVWWTSETFGHGMVVPALSAWLAWRSRAALSTLHPEASWAGLAGLAAMVALWMVADLAGTAVVAQFAVAAMLPMLVWALAGPAASRVFAVPLGFLFFMVPAGEGLNPPLMEVTADATVFALRATGIPVYREGLHFALPTGRWSVVEACSGLRYVIAAAMLSTLFAVLNFERWGKRLVFIGSALLVALAANWARAYLIVMIGHLSGMRWGVGDDHVVYGWVFFGIVMLVVFWMGARWRDDPAALPAMAPAPVPGRGHRGLRAPVDARRFLLMAATIIVVLAGARVVVDRARDVVPRTDLAELAEPILVAARSGPFAMTPVFEGARGRVQATIGPGTRLEAFAAYFAQQESGREMIAFGNEVLADGWLPVSRVDLTVDLGGRPLAVREWRVRAGGAERLVWSWYTIGGFEAGGSEYRAKALTAWSMLTGRGDHSTVSVVGVDLPRLPSGAPQAEQDAAIGAARKSLMQAAAPLRALGAKITHR